MSAEPARMATGAIRLAMIGALSLGAACTTPSAPSSGMPSLADVGLSGGERDVFRLSADADRAYREGRWSDAARRYSELTERVPTDARAWFRLGNTHARQGDHARAIHAYEASLERDAERPEPWFNLSTARLLHARVALSRARDRLDPGDPALVLIDARLAALNAMLHGRGEDS